ncbi:rod-determining factor RdfA [Natronobeatus ordinarius]|uniref:rod-determining factor RdfA n=1 Tax=Natronobeatus ordinarius TaxID=2963433 RepID=UPI0020CF1DD3|nr:rod-determining factor RdfA [Natronobeatus ordinarius]
MTRSRCKVCDAITTYDVSPPSGDGDVDEYLLDRWHGRGDEQEAGYRTLTDWFNRQLLRAVYERYGRETVGTRVEDEYRTLTAEDSPARRELIEHLKGDGINVRAVRESFVSWSTMRHHLTECLGGEKRRPEATTDWERTSIDVAVDRTERTVQEAIRSLANKDELADGEDADVAVKVHLECPECPVRVTLTEALRRGFVCRVHGTPNWGRETVEQENDDEDPT